MESEQPINFTREAFLHPLNLGFMLIGAISAFLLADLDPVSSIVLTMTFGMELMYLGIVPRLPRFRKNLKEKKLRERNSAEIERDMFHELEETGKQRFLVLRHLGKLIKENFDKQPYSSQGLLESIRNKLEELISNYLKLLDLHKRYRFYIGGSVKEELTKEIESERKEMEGLESDQLKRIKARRLDILIKRLKKFEIAREKYLICETHLETIEDAVRYIYEQSMTMNSPEEVGFQLDNLLEEVEETSQIIEDLDLDILPVYNYTDERDMDIEIEVPEEKDMDVQQESSKGKIKDRG